ncbi:MAG: Gfo/Idh/MocA family oxidoreductase [Phycisphaerales bacterium]|nr:Gfo/Idh/MocA family oxidoreductase [Phycisphaerales bacterium]
MNPSTSSRREFIQYLSAAGAATLAAPGLAWARPPGSRRHDTKLRVLSIGVVGTIGEADRHTVASHPLAEIVGLCDVDSEAMAKASKEHPSAFTCVDYREAFDKHGDKFDAVIVSTPDHSHCPIMTLALSRGKHVYGQKPLVQQLEELTILGDAVAARPNLITQVGAQRIQSETRRAAVDILKSGGLGPVIEVHVAFGNGALAGGFYFTDGKREDPCEPPTGFNYDLWLNGAQNEPCRPNMVRRQWRSWFKYGGGQITDWVVHLTDVLFYAFPELQSPTQVCSRTPSRDLSHFHADRVISTITYPVSGSKFANSTCNFYFYDTELKPDRAQVGIGPGEWPDGIFTIVVCKGGTLFLNPEGRLEIWRDGQKTDGMQWPGLPKYESFNHWHAWVDKALGKETPHLWAPFSAGLRCTEPGLLAVKAAKYPGQVLNWDRKTLTFTNHAEATKAIVRREYRKGFEPVRLGSS